MILRPATNDPSKTGMCMWTSVLRVAIYMDGGAGEQRSNVMNLLKVLKFEEFSSMANVWTI